MTTLADILAAALVPRPDRVEECALAITPEAARAALRDTREAMSYLGRALEPEAPADVIRARLLTTLAHTNKRRAVLVVDMIADHLAPGALLEVPRARDVVPALLKRLDAARADQLPVIYVLDEHEPDDPDLEEWGTHAVRGTPGAEVWAELTPSQGDHIVRKPSYSAFFESQLEPLLDSLGIDTLVLTGCLTEVGLLATATDALQRGYAVEVPADTQAGSCMEAEMITLGTIRLLAPFGPARKGLLARRAA